MKEETLEQNEIEMEESSKYRIQGSTLKKAVTILAALYSLYHLYSAGVEALPTVQHRAIHVSVALLLVFILCPTGSKDKSKIPWWDYIAMLGSISVGVYLFLNHIDLIYRQGTPLLMDLVMAVIAMVLVLEACRRTMGKPLVIVALLFIGYSFFGHFLPGMLSHSGYSTSRILEYQFSTTEGIFGVPIYATATFVYIFLLFGAILEVTGGGKAFINLALAITGRFRGGPAKGSVVASGFMGSITGSSFANVVTTGVFTIPLMKKIGYKKDFAVEWKLQRLQEDKLCLQ